MKVNIILILITLFCVPRWASSQAKQTICNRAWKITKFAKDVEKYAAEKGARAFIIARVGWPEKDLPKGIHFSHTAIAVHSNIQPSNGEMAKGYAIHNLYQVDGKPYRSKLLQDHLVDFFLGGGTQRLKAEVIIPSNEIQSRLIDLTGSGKIPNYTILSTQWFPTQWIANYKTALNTHWT